MPLGTVLECDERCLRNLATVLSDSPNSLEKIELEIIFLLGKLAYKSYFQWYEAKESYRKMNPKVVYTNKDLTQCNIINLENDVCGLLKATHTLFATSNTAVYSFNHLSVQGYFCALYISLLPEDQQLQLLKDHITDYRHMWPFFAGITKLKSCDVLDYLLQNAELENNNKLSDLIIVVLNSIYEAQLSQRVCHKYKKTFLTIPAYVGVRPYDCMSISYFMSIASVVHLSLHFCMIGDRGAEMLARCINLISSLKLLDLSGNNITHKGMESVVTIMKSYTNLTHFSITENFIGDPGIQLFALLKIKQLIKLNVTKINMTKVGTHALGEYFKHNRLLQSLEIGHNYIKNGLIRILNSLPSTLVRLIASACCLSYKTAVNIGKMLKSNKSLKYLKISSNSIGDDGISAISDGLHINTTVIQLIARGCGFHSKGAKSIAKMLQANKTLKYLDISCNNIEDSGIKAIALGIQANTTLIQLKVFDCGGAEGIADMLIINKTLKELGITYSNDDIADTVLKTFCKNNCELRQLNIAVHETDDTFNMITNYVDRVNNDNIHATNAAYYITYDNLYYSYAGDNELQKRCILKVQL